jgi:superfamily II DNA or RNA helicase
MLTTEGRLLTATSAPTVSKLRPYQIEPADRLEAMLRAGPAGDLSDCGTGKTFVGCEMIRRLGEPTLVVCPKISMTNWKRAGDFMGTDFDVLNYDKLRRGDTPYLRKEVVAHRNKKVKQEDGTVKIVRVPIYRYVWAKEVKRVVFDEAHRCSALDSLQSTLLRDAVSQGKNPLMITGSVAESPLQLKSIGYAFGLHDNTNFWWWAQQHGCFKPPFGGLKFTTSSERAAEIMGKLHAQIFPEKAIRIRVTDLGDYYKGYVLDCPLIDVPNPAEIDRLNSEIAAALEDLEKRIEERGSTEEHPMTKLLRARQRLDLLKIPAKAELAKDLLATGHTVFLFENFSESITQLRLLFPEAGVIVGDTPQEERQRIMDAVQCDELRIVLLNQQAGGECISLQNITGRYRRASIVSHQHSAKTFRQVIFRTARSGATESALVLMPLVAGTVEEGIKKSVERKSLCLDSLNDGDLTGRA